MQAATGGVWGVEPQLPRLPFDRYDGAFVETDCRGAANFQLELRIMPRSPSIIPEDTQRDVYLVLDDFGSLGRVWRETDEMGSNRAWMVRN
jgi:hypothetical protein